MNDTNETGQLKAITVRFDGSDVLNIITVALGLGAIATNGILCILSRTNPTLKKDAKLLQMTLAVADMILGIGALILAIEAWRIKFIDNWYSAIYCMFLGLTKLFGDAFSLTITMAMASERFLAIAYPLKYRSWNKTNLTLSFIFASVTVCVSFCGIGFIGIDLTKKPSSCGGSSIRINALKPMLSYFNCTVGSMVVILYVAVIVIIRHKGKKFANSLNTLGENSNEHVFKKEVEATRVVMVIVLACIAFYVIPNVTITVLNTTGTNLSFGATTIGNCISGFSLCNASVNFFLYMWKDVKLRQAFINWRKNEIVSIHSSSVPKPNSIDPVNTQANAEASNQVRNNHVTTAHS